MWTPTTRRHHSRTGLRYTSDLTDAEWALLEPLLPPPCDQGRPRSWPLREVVNAISYVLRSGCPWRLLPSDFPPWRTVYRWFAAWRDEGLFRACKPRPCHDRSRAVRTRGEPVGSGDRQPVGQDHRERRPKGLRRRQAVMGRKRHALVDTDGRALLIMPHPASVQDRDGAGPVLQASRRPFPFIARVFADAGYASERVSQATRIAVEIVRKQPDQVGFAVHPRRWVVERLFAWLGRNRRLAKDFEATLASASAFLYAASVLLLTRRLARS